MRMKSAIKITREDKERFDRDGYWISPKLLDDEQIERLRHAHERIWNLDYDGDGYPLNPYIPSEDPTKLQRINNGWWVNDEVRSVVTDPLIGELAADLLETDEIRLWHDQVICKPGIGDVESNSGNVGWHQDYGYWQTCSTSNMITVWIALQDTDLSNGGMMTILGSHKWGLIPESNTFGAQNMDDLKKRFSQDRDWIEEPCILKAGEASFHHALTFHGSGINATNQSRLSIVAHLMPGGTSYNRAHWHPNVRLLGPRAQHGQRFDSEYFPQVFKR